MKKYIIALFLCIQVSGAIVLVASQSAQAVAGATATTPAVNSTGATLAVVAVTNFASSACLATVTDSKGNTYTAVGSAVAANNYACIWYSCNPTVGTGHTFSATGNYANIAGLVYSGTAASSCLGAHSEGSATGNTVQPGSVTPANNNSLLVTVIGNTVNASFSISPVSFNVEQQIPSNTISMAIGVADEIQTTATTRNPTWTLGGGNTDNNAAAIAVFKPAGAAPPSNNQRRGTVIF